MLFIDFNVKVGMKDIFKLTIANESYMKLVLTMELE
jgi:hypothetical protein